VNSDKIVCMGYNINVIIIVNYLLFYLIFHTPNERIARIITIKELI